ncbi:PGF-pre-PGF domain-containing protein [Nanohaloarchaea archaeon]|nr:PGF-pre-PGF domain-containing protein [Candidatus Nanohaloarchaea archaeon]
MKTSKTILLTLILLACLGGATSAPEEPHRLFGAITDSEGNSVEVEGQIEYSGSSIKQFETNKDGSYDIMIPNGDYENEELNILIEGEVVGTVVFEPLEVTEKDLTYQAEEENRTEEENLEEQNNEEDTSGAGGGLGGGGAMPSNEEAIEEAEETNQNETEDNITKDNETEETNNFEKQFDQVEEGEEISLEKPDRTDSAINSVSFTSVRSQETGQVKITEVDPENSEKLTEDLAAEPKGETLSYTEVETDIEAENATFEFEIAREQLNQRNATPEQVVKQRYSEGEWNELETEVIDRNDEAYTFEAYSPEGFSIFATTIREKGDNTGQQVTGQFFSQPSNYALIISILIFIGLVAYLRKDLSELIQR